MEALNKESSSKGAASQEFAPGEKYVLKRDGTKQRVNPKMIKDRIMSLSDGLATKFINFDIIVNKVCVGLYPGKCESFNRLDRRNNNRIGQFIGGNVRIFEPFASRLLKASSANLDIEPAQDDLR